MEKWEKRRIEEKKNALRRTTVSQQRATIIVAAANAAAYRRYFFRCAASGQIKQKFPFVTKAQKSGWSRGPGRINRPSAERVSYDSRSVMFTNAETVAHNEHTHPGQLK